MLKIIEAGKEYYSPKLSKRVKVLFCDPNYAYVRDNKGNAYSIPISELEEIMDDLDMSGDQIVKREG